MKKISVVIGILVGVAVLCIAFNAKSQSTTQTKQSMKLNAGIITSRLAETKAFYTKNLNFEVSFENDFYLLLHTPNQQAQLAFLLPNHASQQPLFQTAFAGKGVFLTIEVPDVEAEYKRIKALKIPIVIELREEPWGDKHFAIVDPNGVGIDIVTYTAPPKE